MPSSSSNNTRAGPPRTALQQACSLDIDSFTCSTSKTTGTGIMCTLGPASWNAKVIAEMIRAGMGIARLNLCHGTLEQHRRSLKLIAEAEKLVQTEWKLEASASADSNSGSAWWPRPLAVAVDTRGSEIRTGPLPDKDKLTDTVYLETDSAVTIDCSPAGIDKPVTPNRLWVDFDNFARIVQPGQSVFIDDGLLELRVESPKPAESAVECLVIVGGQLGAGRCVCLPGVDTGLPEVCQKDLDDLIALASVTDEDSARVHIVMGSFVRSAQTVRQLRQAATVAGRSTPLVVAKIGDARGLQALDEILAEADGVLVARGDLGSELPQEKVFAVQKRIIAVCSTSAKASICATHLLDSMLTRPRPTRAEASDVANAVIDGADCLMLSGETAIGKYPIEAVRTLSKICREAEYSLQPGQHLQLLRRENIDWLQLQLSKKKQQQQQQQQQLQPSGPVCPLRLPAADPLQSSAMAACEAAVRCRASAILVAANHATLPRLTAMFRPPCPVICACADEAICRGLNLWYGLHPIVCTESANKEWLQTAQDRVHQAAVQAKSCGLLPGPIDKHLFVILVEKSSPNTSDLMAIVPAQRVLSLGLPGDSMSKMLGVQLSTEPDDGGVDPAGPEDDFDCSRSSTNHGSSLLEETGARMQSEDID